jgi:hypothetical protein
MQGCDGARFARALDLGQRRQRTEAERDLKHYAPQGVLDQRVCDPVAKGDIATTQRAWRYRRRFWASTVTLIKMTALTKAAVIPSA